MGRHLIGAENDVRELLLRAATVEESDVRRPNLIEDHAADSRLDVPRLSIAVHGLATDVGILETDAIVDLDRLLVERELDFHEVGEEGHTLALDLHLARILREVVAAEHDVLRRRGDRFAARGGEESVGREHEHARFHLRFDGQWHVDRHLVAVEVRVVSCTNERVNPDGFAFDELRIRRLERQAVQGWRGVEQHRMAFGHLLENVPHFGGLLLNHLLRATNGVHVAEFLEAADDEGLEQNERHLLRKTALMELELRTDDNDRTARVVDPLAEQILTEASAFALEHVGKRLQRTIAGTSHGAAVTAVVEQRVDGFLQHALFVPDNNVRRLELQQVLETVVAVDDTTIEIVPVGGRKAAAFQWHERAKGRREDREYFEHHPLRAALRMHESLDELEALRELLADLLGAGVAHRFVELALEHSEVAGLEDRLDG